MPAPTPPRPAQPQAKPTPLKLDHPEIIGVARFRTKDGWRAGRIRSNDPSIFVSLAPPNMKAIAIDELKRGVVAMWESDG